MDDLNPGIAETELGQLRADCPFISRQKKTGDFRILPQCHDSTLNCICRGVIPTHGIEGNPHDGTTGKNYLMKEKLA